MIIEVGNRYIILMFLGIWTHRIGPQPIPQGALIILTNTHVFPLNCSEQRPGLRPNYTKYVN